jgi:hypothetical protein
VVCLPRSRYHEILARSPVHSVSYSTNDDWTVDFKSDWVAKNVIVKLTGAEETDISYLRRISQSTRVVGWFLEPIAHRLITQSAGHDWPLLSMASNEADPPWSGMFLLAYDLPKSSTRSSNLNPSLTYPL